MDNNNLKSLDILSIASFLLGYENLMENREQSRQNNVQSANDKQAKYILEEIQRQFDEQNKKINRILEILEKEK